MKFLKTLVLFFMCFAASAGAAYADAAAKLPAPVIAIVDIQRILEESLASKSVQKQLEAERSKFQNEIEKEENSLRLTEQDLSKERGQLAAEAYSEREQQLRQRFSAAENHALARRKVLDQSYADSMKAVHDALFDVVGLVARERGANLVIVKQQAFWTDQPLDITDEVLRRLDQKMPKIDVAMPAEKPEPAEKSGK
jgi:Skp family chaperone for outer membrane proteins